MFDRFFFLVSGVAMGAVASFVALPTPIYNGQCGVNRLTTKTETAYVLRPPILDGIKQEAFSPSPIVQDVSMKSENIDTSEKRVDEIDKSEQEPRRRRHHRHMRRHREYWR